MQFLAIIAVKKPDFQKAIDHFKEELGSLRSGRASVALVDRITVEAYGAVTPLKGVASITVPDAKTIAIDPWDANVVKDIERALVASDIGITPTVQGKLIRLVMPPMSEDRRKQMVKVVKEKSEDARVALRNVREKTRDHILEMEKKNELTEDERFRAQDELDKLVKQFIEEVEHLAGEKEKEIMTV